MTSIAIIKPTVEPASYLPFMSGHYDIGPGLFKFGADFGNNQLDEFLFQVDKEFDRYHKNKLVARAENLGKYVCQDGLDADKLRHLNHFLIHQLCAEHDAYFSHQKNTNGHRLECHLTGDLLLFNNSDDYVGITSKYNPCISTAWDAWGCQLQEDMALVEIDGEDSRTVALHLCAANHWAAQDKIGRGFLHTHEPVPGFGGRYPDNKKLLSSLVHKGPYVRFAWGLATDTRLNHHPQPPEGVHINKWKGRDFLLSNPELYIRSERQCIFGLPEINSFLFTIRTSFLNVAQLNKESLRSLEAALINMDEKTINYKGLRCSYNNIIKWLATIRQARSG